MPGTVIFWWIYDTVRDHNGNKAPQPFCVVSAIALYGLFYLLNGLLLFIDLCKCKMLWYRSHIVLIFIFVMAK